MTLSQKKTLLQSLPNGFGIDTHDVRSVPFLYERLPYDNDQHVRTNSPSPSKQKGSQKFTESLNVDEISSHWANLSHLYISFSSCNQFPENDDLPSSLRFRCGQLKHARFPHYQLPLDTILDSLSHHFLEYPKSTLSVVWLPPHMGKAYSDPFIFVKDDVATTKCQSESPPPDPDLVRRGIKRRFLMIDMLNSLGPILKETSSRPDLDKNDLPADGRQKTSTDFLYCHRNYTRTTDSQIHFPRPNVSKHTKNETFSQNAYTIAHMVGLIHESEENTFMGKERVYVEYGDRNDRYATQIFTQHLHPDYRLDPEDEVDAYFLSQIPAIEFVRIHKTTSKDRCHFHRDLCNSLREEYEAVFWAEYIVFDNVSKEWVRYGVVVAGRKSIDDSLQAESFLDKLFGVASQSIFPMLLLRCSHLLSKPTFGYSGSSSVTQMPSPTQKEYFSLFSHILDEKNVASYFQPTYDPENEELRLIGSLPHWCRNLNFAGSYLTQKLIGNFKDGLRFSVMHPSQSTLFQPFVASVLRTVYYMTERDHSATKNPPATEKTNPVSICCIEHLSILLLVATKLYQFPALFSRATAMFRRIYPILSISGIPPSEAKPFIKALLWCARKVILQNVYIYPLGDDDPTPRFKTVPPNFRWRHPVVRNVPSNDSFSKWTLASSIDDLEAKLLSWFNKDIGVTRVQLCSAFMATTNTRKTALGPLVESNRNNGRVCYQQSMSDIKDLFGTFLTNFECNQILGLSSLVGLSPHCFYLFYHRDDVPPHIYPNRPSRILPKNDHDVKTTTLTLSGESFDYVAEGIKELIHHSTIIQPIENLEDRVNDFTARKRHRIVSKRKAWDSINYENNPNYSKAESASSVWPLIEFDSVLEHLANHFRHYLSEETRLLRPDLPIGFIPFRDELVTARVGLYLLDETCHHYGLADDYIHRRDINRQMAQHRANETVFPGHLEIDIAEAEDRITNHPITERHDIIDSTFPTPHVVRRWPFSTDSKKTTPIIKRGADLPKGAMCLWVPTDDPSVLNEHSIVFCTQTNVDKQKVTCPMSISPNDSYSIRLGKNLKAMIAAHNDPQLDKKHNDWISTFEYYVKRNPNHGL